MIQMPLVLFHKTEQLFKVSMLDAFHLTLILSLQLKQIVPPSPYTHTQVYILTHTHTDTETHTHTHTQTRRHTHTHTHTPW
jgi:hypothetical protein